jgi:proline-specific peptidase
MTTSFPSEGTIPLSVHNAGKLCSTYYKIIGSLGSSTPLIVLHGGPGAGHEYLLSLSDLHTNFGIPIIFYDQLGCGRSTPLPEKAGDESFWTVDLFINELSTLISHFSLQNTGYYVIGQSWGGMLAGDFAATNPPGLRKLILADAPANSPLMEQGMQELIKKLPESVQNDIDECQKENDFDSERYKHACDAFYVKHLCRLDPWPEEFLVSMKHLEEEPTVYRTMFVLPFLLSPLDFCHGKILHVA